MPPNGNFEAQSYNPFFLSMKILKITIRIPMLISTKHRCLRLIQGTTFSMSLRKIWNISKKNHFLSLNIRRRSKSFESFRKFLDSLCFSFSAVCLSQTWCQPHKTSDSYLQMPGYLRLNQT